MPESIVNVTEGSGKKLHTWSYTVGANTVEDEVVVNGPQPWPTYTALVAAVSTATVNDHLLCLNAGASLKVRVHRIAIRQLALATAVAVRNYAILRTTTAAPTGGTAITPVSFDTSDAAAGAAARSLPTVKGTESTQVLAATVLASQAALATATQAPDRWEWSQGLFGKPIIIPAGTTNGLVVKNLTASAAQTLEIIIEFTETAF